MNIAVVMGKITGQVFESVQSDGQVIVSFDVRTNDVRANSEQAGLTVPCSWFGPREKTPKLDVDATVTVIGCVRRHFYRRGGATTSRTDLLASRVILGGPSRSRSARSKVADQVTSNALSSAD